MKTALKTLPAALMLLMFFSATAQEDETPVKDQPVKTEEKKDSTGDMIIKEEGMPSKTTKTSAATAGEKSTGGSSTGSTEAKPEADGKKSGLSGANRKNVKAVAESGSVEKGKKGKRKASGTAQPAGDAPK